MSIVQGGQIFTTKVKHDYGVSQKGAQIYDSGGIIEPPYDNEDGKKPTVTYYPHDALYTVMLIVMIMMFLIYLTIRLSTCVERCKVYKNRYKGYEELA